MATGKFDKWDVWFAQVKFEDSDEVKARPVIIFQSTPNEVICIKMTSRQPRQGEYQLQRWSEAGLHRESVARMGSWVRLYPYDMIHRIGTLHAIDIVEILQFLE